MSASAALGGTPLEFNIGAITAYTWTRVNLTLSGTRSAIVSYGFYQVTNLADFSLYVDDIIVCDSKSFNIYGIKGLDDGEHVYRWPAYNRRLLDGSHYAVNTNYGRVVTVQFAPISSESDRSWLVDALAVNNSVRIIYASDEVEGVDSMGEEHQLEWVNGIDFVQSGTITWYEKQPIWTSSRRPPSWAAPT
jgi:hypothetical protein